MTTRTGRLVMDRKTGKMVEMMKEDQMLVAIYDPECAKPEDHKFQKVLRSDFTLKKINMLFQCNASFLKDPFSNVLWPKDWMTQVLPPAGKDRWFYIIHERLEPPPQDDLRDPMYTGEAILVLSYVPIQCEELDVKTWLLFGIAQDFPALQKVKTEIEVAQKKKLLLKEKTNAIPTIDVEGTAEQQAEIRRKLSVAIATHASRYDQELETLVKKRKRIEKFLSTEPMRLSLLPVDNRKQQSSDTGNNSQSNQQIETRTWAVAFISSRGRELASVAIEKCDWNYVCLVQTRPHPKAFLEDDQVENEVISAKDMSKEINMRAVRLQRLKHGEGEYMAPITSIESEEKPPLSLYDEDFHISSIGSVYSGQWRLGEKHGMGKEYTNSGVYEGDFANNARVGRGKLVYGKGTTSEGTFVRPTQRYGYGRKYKGRGYPCSLLNGDAFRDGVEHGERMVVTFPDGAKYEGEMYHGKVTGMGRYTSSTGVIEEGSFLDGLLHGDGCRRTFPDGSFQEGRFVKGELNGRGRQQERNGDTYDGFFELGKKEGRGESYFMGKTAKHIGFWHDNMMNGRGDFYYLEMDNNNSNLSTHAVQQEVQSNGEAEDDKWDFWYEGSFVHGETHARHRHVDLHKKHTHYLPFTTNGRSVEKMPFLTNTLPQQLQKLEHRRKKNALRRQTREKEYLQQREFANLSLYYTLLDEFYEQWAQKKQQAKNDAELNPEELKRVQEERLAMKEYEANRAKFRKEKYNLSPRKKELKDFESSLERITLTEQVQLQRAMTMELTKMSVELKQVELGYTSK